MEKCHGLRGGLTVLPDQSCFPEEGGTGNSPTKQHRAGHGMTKTERSSELFPHEQEGTSR